MGRYRSLVGKHIEVDYRAGDIYLTATGKLADDSGKSIFLEEHFCQQGKTKMLRYEIPYQCLVRLREDSRASLPRLPSEDPLPVKP